MIHIYPSSTGSAASTFRFYARKVAPFLAFVFLGLGISGCGKKASDFDPLITEYKQCLETAMDQTSSLSEKTKALQRQLELNNEYQSALQALGSGERQKLMMKWAVMLSEVADKSSKKQ